MRFLFNLYIYLIFISIFLSPSNFSTADERSKEINAVCLKNWKPLYFIDENTGEPDGFAIDIMNKVAQLSGIKINYLIYNDWPDVFKSLESGEALIAPNLGITDDRLKLYDFTIPYETFRISIFVRSDSVDINSESDLVGKKIGVVNKNQGMVLVQKRVSSAKLQIYDTVDECFMALLSGNVDAIVYPEQIIKKIIIKSGLEKKIKTVGKPLQEIKRAIAIRKGSPQLFELINSTITQFIKTDEYKDIYAKWYGEPKTLFNAKIIIIAMSIMFILTVASMMTWRYISIMRLNRILLESRERLKAIIDNTNAGYFLIDRSGKFQQVNNAWLRIHGYESADEVVGQHFSLVQPDSYMETAENNVNTLLNGQNIPSGEFGRVSKDGSIGYHTYSAHPVIHRGQVIGLEGFLIDINDIKRAEKALKESEEKYKLLFESAGDAIFIHDTEWNILRINTTAAKVLGYTYEELSLMTIEQLSTTEEIQKMPERLAQLMKDRCLTLETVYKHKDGSNIPMELNVKVITWDGKPAIMSICRDITERKRSEEQSHQLKKAESLKRMAGAVAHIFNNQLFIVIGNLEIALDDLAKNSVSRENLLSAMQAAQKSADISGLMLTYLSQGISHNKLLDISQVCQQSLMLLKASIPKWIAFEADSIASGIEVVADANQIHIILQHLVVNAIESIGNNKGRVNLSLKTIPASDLNLSCAVPRNWKSCADNYACIEVSDTGCGMTIQDVTKIFDPFFTTKFAGRGLGLPVILGIVNSFDGAICVDSVKDKGSVFTIILPILKDDGHVKS
ncbi:MAG: PAS domain S-box protein [Desulfamplus sp.]|nr:PAS domain S-box protein [Desulfamplus sp.]